VLLGMFIALRKSMKKLHQVTERAEVHLLPALATAQNLLEEISPKIKVATQNLVEVSDTLRHQASHIDSAVTEVIDRTKVQTERVDEMVTGVLNSITHSVSAVQGAVSSPLRQVHGIFNGVRAGIDVLRNKGRNTHVEGDGEEFI
jgi:phage-related protein